VSAVCFEKPQPETYKKTVTPMTIDEKVQGESGGNHNFNLRFAFNLKTLQNCKTFFLFISKEKQNITSLRDAITSDWASE